MQIRTNDGKFFGIIFIGSLMRDGNRVVIELKDDRALSEIAADFENRETITMTDSARPNVEEVYRNFTQLIGIQRNKAAGTVRITLEKGD